MQFGIKHRVLLLALVPTITVSILLMLSKAISIFLLGIGISALLAYRMGRNLTQPILEMEKVVNKIREGDLNTRTSLSAYPELKILGSGINAMAETLENAHNELQHKINQATLSLRRTLETIEVQNIELDLSRKAAEHANKIKSEFLADMSHEIRTPLNSVLGFINLLRKTELNQTQYDYIRTIQKSANNLMSILNDILDFSKIEAGKLRIGRSIMDIRECIDETLNLLLPHAQEKNITLIPLLYSDVPRHVLSDPLRIKQIITNLVSNAIKFTERGSVIIRVMLESESFSHTTLRIHVTDTGIGLSAEEQKVLFQAFNQTHMGATHKLGGTGLGLVICKKLVEQMGGTIGVESELESGSTFWFTFQVEPVLETQLLPLPAEPVPVPEKQPRLALTSSSPVTVLVVDDNADNLKLIQILLSDMGIQVSTRNDGKTAIAAVRQQVFDLILMDIRMPNMDGIETTRIIRNIEAEYHRKPTPIIALTANSSNREKPILFENGINDYLEKPIGEIELKNILHKWVGPKIDADTIDWTLGKKLAGDRIELAKEFFEKLIEILPLEQQQINEAYRNRNWQALSDHAHKLHGVCAYCGVPKLKACVQKLEKAVSSGLLDVISLHFEAFNLAADAVMEAAKEEA